MKFSEYKKLSEYDKVHLIIAALYHDIATPPFAHTVEYVLNNFDHEIEAYKILSYKDSDNIEHGFPVFASQFPQFKLLKQFQKEII